MNSVGERSQVFAPGLLDGSVALVTGGGTGLGKASALELVRCGARVTIVGRRRRGARGRGHGDQRVRGGGVGADWMAGDVRDSDEARRMVGTVLERHGRLDVLVNNAGGQFFSPAELIAAKGWRAVWRLNVEGGLNMAEAAFELAFAQAGTRHGRERDAVAPQRHARDGALGVSAGDRRGAHARSSPDAGSRRASR